MRLNVYMYIYEPRAWPGVYIWAWAGPGRRDSPQGFASSTQRPLGSVFGITFGTPWAPKAAPEGVPKKDTFLNHLPNQPERPKGERLSAKTLKTTREITTIRKRFWSAFKPT